MSDPKETKISVAVGQEETIAALQDLKERFERGDIKVAALRVYNVDGTWEDIVLGDDVSETEHAEALESLRRLKDGAH
jgi:hypothetical protein